MFSAHGKKKLLLRIQRAKDRGIENPLEYLGLTNSDISRSPSPAKSEGRSKSPNAKKHTSPSALAKSSKSGKSRKGFAEGDGASGGGDGTFGFAKGFMDDFDAHAARAVATENFDAHGYIVGQKRGDDSAATTDIATMAHLKKLLADESEIGRLMNLIMATTAKFRPDRDYPLILKSFYSKTMEYDVFRQKLLISLGLKFTDVEFAILGGIFDPANNGVVDGYQFTFAFKKLNMIRQDIHDKKVREQQALTEKSEELEELHRTLALEKKLEDDIDFEFGYNEKVRTQKKMIEAAKKFDQMGTGAPSLESFANCTMKPALFRQMIRQLFNLKLSPKELGALLNLLEMPLTKTIDCSEFLRQFLALGIEKREKERIAARRKQELYERKVQMEEEAKIKRKEEKGNFSIDYDFSELDVARANAKLTEASTKYDRSLPGCKSLDCFEVDHLGPGAFRDALRRTFNLHFTDKEMGALVRRFDKENVGHIDCAKFTTSFLKVGQEERYKLHREQLERQREMIKQAEEEHKKKMEENFEKKTFAIDYQFDDHDMSSALAKMLEASTKYDKSRGATLDSFEPESLTPLLFYEAMQRTFNIHFTPSEMGAVMCTFDKEETGKIHCKSFLNTFMSFGIKERERRHRIQLKTQRMNEKRMAEEHERKIREQEGKLNIEVSFDYDEDDRDSALAKLTEAAIKYDRSHPSAMALDGFNSTTMDATIFKEMIRRTFNLKVNAREAGALVRHFSKTPNGITVDCPDFIIMFTQLGNEERARMHREQLERQRNEDKARLDEEKRKWNALQGRHEIRIDAGFTQEEADSAMKKLLHASTGYDKNHPAAPSLTAFECKTMTPGIFRECMKRAFGMRLSPGEVAYIVSLFDTTHTNQITCQEFLNRFITMGVHERYERHKKFLAQEREAAKEKKAAHEAMLKAQFEKSELKVDWSFTPVDLTKALEKMTACAAKFDKNHPAAPSLEGFTVGYLTPGAFRELVKQSFKLHLEPKELAALIKQFPANEEGTTVDPKAFIVNFVKMGFEERARIKAKTLQQQRESEERVEAERERKKKLSEQRLLLSLDNNFGEGDRISAMNKLKEVSSKYDKNAPGCPSLEAFEALYLIPSAFRDVIRRSFRVHFTPKEFSALIDAFKDKQGNVICHDFLLEFLRLGAEQRAQDKLIELEKTRLAAIHRKTEHARKMKEAEDKMVLDITYDYSPEQRASAFKKIAAAAKKYDRSHPGAVALDGFECLELEAGAFRDIVRRTFNLQFTAGELGAVVQHFDKSGSGKVHSKDFESHFLKVGIAERNKDHSESLRRQREDDKAREKEHQDKLAAQWAKHELAVASTITDVDRANALEKLTTAAFKYDAASPGPIGLNAFQTSVMTPAVFREMLKRSFDVRLTDGELAAMIEMFDTDQSKKINCTEFINRFIQLGYQKRSEARNIQLEKDREYLRKMKTEGDMLKAHLDEKKEIGAVDNSFTKEDFQSALQKIRRIAGNYELGHSSAPSLKGFSGGGTMRPAVFKDMIYRTFHENLSPKELGAIVKYFDKHGNGTVDLQDFMAHFFTTQREEQNLRRQREVARKHEIEAAKKVEEDRKHAEKLMNERNRLKYTSEDEVTFLEKIRKAAQTYAIDSHAFAERLQAFKGPSMFPQGFRDVFYNVFLIRFSFPEMGVLLSILDISGTLTLDGPKFLNWLYRIARKEEKILLGEIKDDVTLDSIRLGGNPADVANSTKTAKSAKPRSRSSSPDPKKLSSTGTTSYQSFSLDALGASFESTASSAGAADSKEIPESKPKPVTAGKKPGRKGKDMFIVPGMLANSTDSLALGSSLDQSSKPGSPSTSLTGGPNNSDLFVPPESIGLGRRSKSSSMLPAQRSHTSGANSVALDRPSSTESIPTRQVPGSSSPVKLAPLSNTAPAAMTQLIAAQAAAKAKERSSSLKSRGNNSAQQKAGSAAVKLNRSMDMTSLDNKLFSSSVYSSVTLSSAGASMDSRNNDIHPSQGKDAQESVDLSTLEAILKGSEVNDDPFQVADRLRTDSRLDPSTLLGPLGKLKVTTKQVPGNGKPVPTSKLKSLPKAARSTHQVQAGGFLFPGLLAGNPSGVVANLAPVPLSPSSFL